MTMQNQKLWKCVLGVRPSPDHPRFYDWEFGQLIVFLFDRYSESAAHRAYRIVSDLPYELAEKLGEKCNVRCYENLRPIAECAELFNAAERQARQFGISFFVVCAPVGETEPKDYFNLPEGETFLPPQ